MKKWLIALLSGSAILGGSAYGFSQLPTVVQYVVDGDTIAVRDGVIEKRVRLLNIDTPEMGGEGQPSECFAKEAGARLAELLPEGTRISLEYDIEVKDRYGRDLAGVFKGDEFVNEVMAREGLARAMVIPPNERFYERIRAAEAEAAAEKLGIFTASPGCYFANDRLQREMQSLEESHDRLTQLDLDDPRNLVEARKAAEEVRRTSSVLKRDLSADVYFYGTEAEERIEEREHFAKEASKRLEDTEVRERQRIEAERQRVEAERRAREDAERAEEEARQREAAESARKVTQSPSNAGSPSGSYTGCRAYGGNYSLNNVDDKGRRYAKIDCATKVQIG